MSRWGSAGLDDDLNPGSEVSGRVERFQGFGSRLTLSPFGAVMTPTVDMFPRPQRTSKRFGQSIVQTDS